MKRIKDTIYNEIIIEKSRFISYLFIVDNENDINSILKEYSKKYSDATHIVYAYRIGIIERSNDNNEPKGTAGVPTLEVLRKNDLDHILCITIRYFGGIKLGASGLLRAYSSSASEAVKKATILSLTKAHVYDIKMDYKESSYFESHFSNYLELYKTYNDKVLYHIIIKEDNINNLKDVLVSINNKYEILNEETKELYL